MAPQARSLWSRPAAGIVPAIDAGPTLTRCLELHACTARAWPTPVPLVPWRAGPAVAPATLPLFPTPAAARDPNSIVTATRSGESANGKTYSLQPHRTGCRGKRDPAGRADRYSRPVAPRGTGGAVWGTRTTPAAHCPLGAVPGVGRTGNSRLDGASPQARSYMATSGYFWLLQPESGLLCGGP